MTKIVTPETAARNAAFAAALAELIPPVDPDLNRITILADHTEHRRIIIARAALGDFAKGGKTNVPRGIVSGFFGVTLEQYRAVHMLIYQDGSGWSRDITGGGNDEADT